MHGPVARCARCDCPRTPTRPLVLATWGRSYCGLCCGFVMADHDRADPTQPKPRELPLEAWIGTELIGERPVAEWPWKEIRAKERQAKSKANAEPKCRVCGQPLLVGQTGLHWACRPT